MTLRMIFYIVAGAAVGLAYQRISTAEPARAP